MTLEELIRITKSWPWKGEGVRYIVKPGLFGPIIIDLKEISKKNN